MKKENEEKEILETFCKFEVNLPPLEAIKQGMFKNYAPTIKNWVAMKE